MLKASTSRNQHLTITLLRAGLKNVTSVSLNSISRPCNRFLGVFIGLMPSLSFFATIRLFSEQVSICIRHILEMSQYQGN